MPKTLDEAIEELVADITKMEVAVREKKKTVNTLCGVAQRDPLYPTEEPTDVVPTRIRPDQFYGQALASAVRTILETRRQQNLGAATVNEIFDVLSAGGYQFQTKSDDVSRASLRNSLAKNTTTFHKLPGGQFGLLSWYPNAKKPKAPGAGNGNGGQADDEQQESEEATAEGSTAAS